MPNQPPLPEKIKTGGPPGLINSLAYPRLINPQCWNSLFLTQNSLFTILFVSHRTCSAEIPCFQNCWFPIFFGGARGWEWAKMAEDIQPHVLKFTFLNQNYLFPRERERQREIDRERDSFCFSSLLQCWNSLVFNPKKIISISFVSHHASPISEPWDFSNQISSNPIESCGVHEILAIKSHQIQWHLMGSMTF